MPKGSCGYAVNSWLIKPWISGGVLSTVSGSSLAISTLAVLNHRLIRVFTAFSPTSYPRSIMRFLPLSEHTFYPVSTAPTNTPTRKERIL